MSARRRQRELDDLVLRLKGLVLVRAFLETHGASVDELNAHTAEIARVRGRLAQVAKGWAEAEPASAA